MQLLLNANLAPVTIQMRNLYVDVMTKFKDKEKEYGEHVICTRYLFKQYTDIFEKIEE